MHEDDNHSVIYMSKYPMTPSIVVPLHWFDQVKQEYENK